MEHSSRLQQSQCVRAELREQVSTLELTCSLAVDFSTADDRRMRCSVELLARTG